MPSTITSLKSSTLNEDGDFCIEGINDDKTTNNNSSGNNNNNNNNNNKFTSLLDMEYNQIKNSKLSDITKPYQFAETNPQDDVRFETTDDDYIPNDDTEVIIMDQFSSFLNAGVQGATARPAYNDLSTADRVDSTNTVLPSVSTGIESQSGRSNSQVVPQSQNRIALDEKDHAAIEALEGFLSSIFDGQVKARDIHLYACDLVAIGFDPDCDMGKELEFDDLEFMKKLHQRFFWKEWQRLLL
ncbi:unnamed protein product [Cylindrotheca closterium]|uniref:Uncharacterized protein n=1 Tax=Cylindrotheca closterium TaxID=2856 RepID=A0AAD2FKB3_9STRA|nr:unnamed protein product [Cylindrotheca closterium]